MSWVEDSSQYQSQYQTVTLFWTHLPETQGNILLLTDWEVLYPPKSLKWCAKQIHVSNAKMASCYAQYIPIPHGYRFNWKSTSLSKNVPTLATTFFITCLNYQWFHVPNVTYIQKYSKLQLTEKINLLYVSYSKISSTTLIAYISEF